MRRLKESTLLAWFLIPLLAIAIFYFTLSRTLFTPAPGTVIDEGRGYEGVRQANSITYNFTEGYRQVEKALTELFALSGFEPSEIARVNCQATYTQPLQEISGQSWFRSRLPKKLTWPYKELTVVTPFTDAGLLVFDYQRMLESKLWSFGAEVLTEEIVELDPAALNLDKLDQLLAETEAKKVVGLTLEIGYQAAIDGTQVTVVTHKVTLVQPWVESYAQRYPYRVKPRIALIIDDWGYDHSQAVQAMFDLPVKLNMAVIPGLPKSWDQALVGFSKGWEVMLHLPMEPRNPNWRLGEYAIKTEMTETEIRETVRKALDAVPAISGVNNHMGSKATADPRVMRVVLDEVVNKSGLFFVDSRTTGASAVPQVAREMGISIVQNSVFLDNEDDIDYILKHLNLLVEVAKRQGEALGIGHLRLNTARALERFVRSEAFQDVELVLVSELISK
ncbi:MAG: divergent polysaccharide deacetylase family protein [Firmicutes bacterium]|nr:divergent polysaccharide deacetylase family protein [Bacillota bacterium]